MTVSLHKISAGDGYLYLVRQVAASDATHRGRSALADYYSVKGETPGRWLGKGLTALADPGARDVSAQTVEQVWAVQAGSEVTEDQMKALFGEGLHPNATKISDYLIGRGLASEAAINGAKLGRKFAIYDDPPFVVALSQAYREHNIAL
ncbi:relaxase domain-containing protein, partial [Mycobacteroides abscessus]|uniref:relaxase domain-containing protein n=1 Tax=Mycobacteroides abscessus TaxID=36809 RepID=UPI001F360CC9